MSTFKSRLSNLIDVRNERNPTWIPARLRGLIRRVSGGDSWTAQMLRGLLWQYRWLVGLALVANIAAAVFEGSTMAVFTLALQVLSGDVLDISSSDWGVWNQSLLPILGRMEGNTLFLTLVGLAVVTQILRSAFQFGGQVAAAYLTAWLEGHLRQHIFHQFVAVSYAEFSKRKIGDLIVYLEQIRRVGLLVMSANRLITDLLIATAYLIVLLWLSWPMTLLALGGVLLLSRLVGGIRAHISTLAQKLVDINVIFHERVVELLQGMRLLHTFGRTDYAMEIVDDIITRTIPTRRMGIVRHVAIIPLVQAVTVLGVALFLVAGYSWMEDDPLVIPRLLTFVFVLYRLMPFTSNINHTLGSINEDLPFLTRIATLLRTDDKEYPASGASPITEIVKGIEFAHVTLRYPDSQQNALSNLSFFIPQGKMIALVGASGSGKSSVVNLLLRLYEPTQGDIRVDGVSLRQLRTSDWRRMIGVVDQETFVFHASVADNIRFGRLDATQNEIETAAKVANAHRFIINLEHGYSTLVGDRGYRLSGGQRQRLAIARAVLRNPQLLIFDEATSSLDSHSEQSIQRAMETLRNNRTVLVIAHRLSTIIQADQIIVLDEGRIAEQGTHAALLQKDGRYASLWNLQADKSGGGHAIIDNETEFTLHSEDI